MTFLRYSFLVFLLPVFISCSSMKYSGPETDHFDGEKFHNLIQLEDKISLWEFIKLRPWRFNKESEDKWLWKEITPTNPSDHDFLGARVIFINHASFLIQINGINILTDPIWSNKCGPFGRLGPSRFHKPGILFEDLPKVDIVLVSHNHYDHMDLATLKRLKEKHNPLFIVGLGNTRYLKFIDKNKIIELDWWQKRNLYDLNIYMVPAQHWSIRTRFDVNESLWGGFFIESKNSSIFFAGDTAEGPHFNMVRKRIGEPQIALLPIGAYLPRDFMKSSHMGPKEAVEAFKLLKAKKAVAMHFGTFPLGKDGPKMAAEELKRVLNKEKLQESFIIPEPGSIIQVRK